MQNSPTVGVHLGRDRPGWKHCARSIYEEIAAPTTVLPLQLQCYRCRRVDEFDALRLPGCKAQDQLRPLADGSLTEDINMRLIYVYGEINL